MSIALLHNFWSFLLLLVFYNFCIRTSIYQSSSALRYILEQLESNVNTKSEVSTALLLKLLLLQVIGCQEFEILLAVKTTFVWLSLTGWLTLGQCFSSYISKRFSKMCPNVSWLFSTRAKRYIILVFSFTYWEMLVIRFSINICYLSENFIKLITYLILLKIIFRRLQSIHQDFVYILLYLFV